MYFGLKIYLLIDETVLKFLLLCNYIYARQIIVESILI